jgi:hypothetical protein
MRSRRLLIWGLLGLNLLPEDENHVRRKIQPYVSLHSGLKAAGTGVKLNQSINQSPKTRVNAPKYSVL